MAIESEQIEVPQPKVEDEDHFFQVTLVVRLPQKAALDDIWCHVAAACIQSNIPVVGGWHAAVKNLTFLNAKTQQRSSWTGPVSFNNKPIPKKLDKIVLFQRRPKKGKKKK